MTITNEISTNHLQNQTLLDYHSAIDAACELNDYQQLQELIDSYEIWIEEIVESQVRNQINLSTFNC